MMHRNVLLLWSFVYILMKVVSAIRSTVRPLATFIQPYHSGPLRTARSNTALWTVRGFQPLSIITNMIYFLILPTRKFIHTHCIKLLGLLNANTCDHPRCPLLFFNPYSPPLSYTLFLFCTLQFGCISIGWFVSTPDLFLVFALHFLIFASLLMFPCLQICVRKVHKTPGWWLATAATCLLGLR
jgi:hypothetical protein